MKIYVDELVAALHASWAADTAFDASDWSPDNPARGHCVVSALVVQDYLGGDLQRYEVEGEVRETHYVNMLNHGAILDATGSQYDGLKVHLTPTATDLKGFASIREKRLADESTRRRYEMLKTRVQSVLNQ